jgi:hypothetical protein
MQAAGPLSSDQCSWDIDVTDHKPDPSRNAENQEDQLDPQVELEVSLEAHLQEILNQIETAEPGLLEAEQMIGDDGKPRFSIKPKPPKPKQAPPPPTPAPPAPAPVTPPKSIAASSFEAIEEDDLAALINQAIDQASGAAKPSTSSSGAPATAVASDAELTRAVDRDIDQAVQQAAQAASAKTPTTTPKAASPQAVSKPKAARFDPADNFIPIEPSALADAIDEAFANPPKPVPPVTQATHESEPAPVQAAAPPAAAPTPSQPAPAKAVSKPKASRFNPADNFIPIEPSALADAIDEAFANPPQPVMPITPEPEPAPVQAAAPTSVASPQAAASASDQLADIPDDAKLGNDDLDALFAAIGDAGFQTNTQTKLEPEPQPVVASSSDKLADLPDDAKLNNDDLDALFAAMGDAGIQTTESVAPDPHLAAVKPSNPIASMQDTDRVSNDDLDALFADPATLLAEEEAQRKASEAADFSPLNEASFTEAWDQALNQAQQELARLTEAKHAKQASRLDAVRNKSTLTPDLKELLEDEPQSVFDDDAFAQQWDNVLNQAREQLSSIAAPPATKPKATLGGGGGKLSNEDLSAQLDDLLAQAQESENASDGDQAIEPFDESQFTDAWDSVLGEAMNQLTQLAGEKLKKQAQRQSQKMQVIRQSLTDEQLADDLDALIQQALQSHDPTNEEQPEYEFDESEFAAAWGTVLDQAKQELNQIAQKKSLSKPAAAAAQQASAAASSPAPSMDLANELDSLLSSAFEQSDTTEQPAEASTSHEISASEIQDLIDSVEAAPEPAHDPAVDEPQDPAAMITHIDSLLAEHANEAVEDVFETPEKIAAGTINEEDLEAAFQSPEQVLQNLQEASDNTQQAQAPSAKPARPTPQPIASVTPNSQSSSAEFDPNDLEGYFEAPEELTTDIQAQAANAPELAAEEALVEQVEEADELMGDFVSPEVTQEIPEAGEYVAVEDSFESADEVLAQEAKPAKVKQAVTQSLEQPSEDQEAPAPRGPSLLSRLIQRIKPLGHLATKAVHGLGSCRKHLSPTVNKACAMINRPLQRFDKQTQNLVGYVGLVQIFLTVILVCVIFKKMLFGE